MLQLPDIVKKVWRTPFWRINPNEKAIYLTFDDGPDDKVTPKVLDVLDEFDAKATFFCVGENVMKHPDVFDEVKRRGHAVGNHTFSHLKGFKTPTDTYVENVWKAHELIQSSLFRPPHGQLKLAQQKQLKSDFRIIMWDLITYDYDANVSPKKILQEIQRKSRNGSIVVFHNSRQAEKNVLAALPAALEFWKREGWEMGVIS